MRQPVRPFITAYKNRSSKSRTPRPWAIDDPEKAIPHPLPDPGADAPSGPDADYLAAMAAADAVFGGKAVEAGGLQEPANVPAGRILPCLLHPEAEPAFAADEAKKPRRAPRAVEPTARKAVKPAIAAPIRPAIAKQAIEPTQVIVTHDIPESPAARRDRSAIQNRWVLKSELKPGEKWKRRLCKAAR